MSSHLQQPSPGRRIDPTGGGFADRLISPWEDAAGVRTFLEERAGARCEYYGSGKVALRDALDVIARNADQPKTNVVLPAYVPSALLEPIKEAGYTPRLHRITRELRPDLDHVESLLDDESVALLSVNYFGFSQPDHAALRGHAADAAVPLIEDNAHSALSMTPEGTLLGTRGDIGFTSFKKTLPVPNGAALFVWREGLRDGPFPRSGIRTRPTGADGKFVLRRIAKSVGTEWPLGNGDKSHEGALTDGRDLAGRDPRAVYEAASVPMSRLTAVLLDHLRPGAIIESKRHNFRERWETVSALPDAHTIFDTLPAGTCPKAFPVLVEDVAELAAALDRPAASLPRWPPLPIEVAQDARFATSQHLAKHLIPLPV